MLAAACVILIIIIIAVASGISSRRAALAEAEAAALAEAEAEAAELAEAETFTPIEDLPWYLRLINNDFPLDPTFAPELSEIVYGHFIDSRIYETTRQMLNDAEAEGLQLFIVSSFRTYEGQKALFDQEMWNWQGQGFGLFDAYHRAAESVAIPGSSEHQAGLALDIVAANHSYFDENLEETPEIQWLKANAWRYGFILRYPADAIHITGIIYEPWHWRYVGIDAAREIHERRITLEEFLGVYPTNAINAGNVSNDEDDGTSNGEDGNEYNGEAE